MPSDSPTPAHLSAEQSDPIRQAAEKIADNFQIPGKYYDSIEFMVREACADSERERDELRAFLDGIGSDPHYVLKLFRDRDAALDRAELAEGERDALCVPLPDRYPCQRCGRRDGLDSMVGDELWALLSGGKWNILCLWCMDELAVENGVEAGVSLHFCGHALHGSSQPEPLQEFIGRLALRAEAAESQLTEAREQLAAAREDQRRWRWVLENVAWGEWEIKGSKLGRFGIYGPWCGVSAAHSLTATADAALADQEKPCP